jgi:hypothetical protein
MTTPTTGTPGSTRCSTGGRCGTAGSIAPISCLNCVIVHAGIAVDRDTPVEHVNTATVGIAAHSTVVARGSSATALACLGQVPVDPGVVIDRDIPSSDINTTAVSHTASGTFRSGWTILTQCFVTVDEGAIGNRNVATTDVNAAAIGIAARSTASTTSPADGTGIPRRSVILHKSTIANGYIPGADIHTATVGIAGNPGIVTHSTIATTICEGHVVDNPSGNPGNWCPVTNDRDIAVTDVNTATPGFTTGTTRTSHPSTHGPTAITPSTGVGLVVVHEGRILYRNVAGHGVQTATGCTTTVASLATVAGR